MIPKIKVDVGRGLDPVELQQRIDTDLKTRNTTVVGAINELLDRVDQWNAVEESVIEKIFVNNTEVSIIDKAVRLTIPTKASDVGAAAEKHDHDGVYLKADEPIPAALLPSYVDDVIEVTTFEDLPNPGESGKIYLVVDANKTYRWSGSKYVAMYDGVVLGETADTAFRGDLGKIAYEHAVSEHAPVNAQENVIEVFKVAGTILPIEDKTVDIPIATDSVYGVVKSSSGNNQVSIEVDGTMRVEHISTSTLRVPDGEEFILNGGSSSISVV